MFPLFGGDNGENVNEHAAPDALSVAVIGASVIDPLLEDIQQKLDEQQLNIALKDYAVPGNTASRETGRIDTILASEPDIVLLSLGGNDIRYAGTLDDANASLDRLETSLTRIIETAKTQGVTIAAIGLDPADLQHVAARIHEIHGEDAADIIDRIEGIYDMVETSVDYYHPSLHAGLQHPLHFNDAIHPNAEGNALLAEEFASFIQDISAKERVRHSGVLLDEQSAMLGDEPDATTTAHHLTNNRSGNITR